MDHGPDCLTKGVLGAAAADEERRIPSGRHDETAVGVVGLEQEEAYVGAVHGERHDARVRLPEALEGHLAVQPAAAAAAPGS